LWQLLLGILDKATLTLGDNQRVDFSKTIVIMTSNLGAREMSELISGGIGFAPSQAKQIAQDTEVDKKIYRTAVEAARRNFSPEFMNRIDKVVVFRSLKEEHLREIVELELQHIQDHIMSASKTKFIFQCSDGVKELFLREGVDRRYGARHLKRAIERILVYPLANLVATEQVGFGDQVSVEVIAETDKLTFTKSARNVFIYGTQDSATETASVTESEGASVPRPRSRAARKG
jgi:ATP-dependent Clp protease ATP-binding subunit ClpA